MDNGKRWWQHPKQCLQYAPTCMWWEHKQCRGPTHCTITSISMQWVKDVTINKSRSISGELHLSHLAGNVGSCWHLLMNSNQDRNLAASNKCRRICCVYQKIEIWNGRTNKYYYYHIIIREKIYWKDAAMNCVMLGVLCICKYVITTCDKQQLNNLISC